MRIVMKIAQKYKWNCVRKDELELVEIIYYNLKIARNAKKQTNVILLKKEKKDIKDDLYNV